MAIDAKKVLENKLNDVRVGRQNALNENYEDQLIDFDVSKNKAKKMTENYIKWADESIVNLEKAIEKLNE